MKVRLSDGEAVTFSREPASLPFLVHIGVYCFSPGSLRACAGSGSTPESRSMRLEQLAWMRNGIRIGVVTGDYTAQGVDTPEDLERVRGIFGGGG